jgi:hypothetical protein
MPSRTQRSNVLRDTPNTAIASSVGTHPSGLAAASRARSSSATGQTRPRFPLGPLTISPRQFSRPRLIQS